MATRPVTLERAGAIVTGKLKAYDLPKIHWPDVPGLNARPSRTFVRLGPERSLTDLFRLIVPKVKHTSSSENAPGP